MKLLISGHRIHKLSTYHIPWIKLTIGEQLESLVAKHGYVRGYSGMASGVDLWFCQECSARQIPYVACIPFDEQGDTMSKEDREYRDQLIKVAVEVRKVKNSWIVEECDMALVVWNGDKGGTHNVVQQLVEKNKPFHWINPVAMKVWDCV